MLPDPVWRPVCLEWVCQRRFEIAQTVLVSTTKPLQSPERRRDARGLLQSALPSDHSRSLWHGRDVVLSTELPLERCKVPEEFLRCLAKNLLSDLLLLYWPSEESRTKPLAVSLHHYRGC